ncbi:MAG TPA: efflux RND transporter periplasmic adaptor subunit, partial [Pirellulales bacterium]|nr:efflux RND transporter periplasmic adaptor subunit [Pirellulales bacterium]
MLHSEALGRWVRLGGRLVVLLAFAGGVSLLLFWLAGKFAPKVPARPASEPAPETQFAGRTVEARWLRLPLVETAVGSIRAVHETTVGSKLLARVVGVELKAGQHVRAGDVLVRLDDADLQAKLEQAQAAMTSAEAAHAQAMSDEKRYGSLLKSNAASRQDYERAATAVRSTAAELRRGKEIVNEVQSTLDWATVRSPMDGTVIDKKVDVGDLVTPGQMLVTLFDPKRMQLVANVRESLAHRLDVGQMIEVEIEGLKKRCTGMISEIVPQSQAASRSFQVKVTGPCPTGV